VAFLYDDTYEKGARIDRLLRGIRSEGEGEE
jgi:hypothetical protein